MSNNENQNKNASSLPEGLSSIADDEAITEIDFNDFLEESSKASPIFEGFHEDIENTEKSIESELQSLYDDIMGSGPETIVPKPMSVLTSTEADPKKVALSDPGIPGENEPATLDDLWMNPEDYFDDDIPVVSLDEGEQNAYAEEEQEIPEEAVFAPEKAVEAPAEHSIDDEKNDIFNMINMIKDDTNGETGFREILSEIEANEGIATVEEELSSASQLVTDPAVYEAAKRNDTEFDWGGFESEDDGLISEDISEKTVEEPAEKPASDFSIAGYSSEEEFEKELAYLLGDEVPEDVPEEKPAQSETAAGFVIDIPDDGNDYVAAAAQPEKLYEPEPMSSGISYITEEEFEAQQAAEEGKKSKKEKKQNEEKPSGGAGDVIRKIILAISVITIVVSCGILVNTYIIEPMKFKKASDELASQMIDSASEHEQADVSDSGLESQFPGVDFPEGMLAKYGQLYAQNSDLAGWITISALDINLPIAQGEDNDYYLKKDIYQKYTTYGVPFFDYRMTDLRNLHRNTVVYGHNMRYDDYIFGNLENYREISGFEQAPVIECNTIYGDYTWFVYAVFITNSRESDDNGYLFPYNFIDISDAKFEDYIEEIDKRKLYTTGVDINANDKILTLSTCCYDFEDARLVVVARLKREGESVSVDTSKAYYNQNPKYPQAWYDANKKTNPYAEDTRW